MKLLYRFLSLLIPVLIISCGGPERQNSGTLPADNSVPRCTPFDLGEVTLLEGPFLDATLLNVKSLLQYEPDRLLAKFRIEAGLAPKAEHYGGWEGMTLAGHSLGHYLSGCSLMYRTTGDPRFLERVSYMVEELNLCQQANGQGYIGAFPDGQRILEEEVGKGIIHASSFDLNGIWAPFYTMHKVMAGLRDACHLCDNEQALRVESKLADWLRSCLAGLTEEQVQEMLQCEHGGMNEVLADLYADTGDEAYLDLSGKFYHHAILDPLSRGEDILSGKHGNTQIPKLIGLARRYELTGDSTDRKAAEFFWDRVVHHHSYVNGSHGFHEYFGPPDSLNQRLGSTTSESCNVYNMLKLSTHLFSWTAAPEVADYYENALINHILSSQHPETGQVLYFHSLQMGGHKEFQDPFAFTCCIGTGMENHSKYGEAIYFRGIGELFVNLFIASELRWEEEGLILRQETGFPEEQSTRLRFINEEPVKLTIQLRIPSWADASCAVQINGKKVKDPVVPGSYMSLYRNWRKGDEIVLDMPFPIRVEPMPDNPRRIAICCGPLVLASDFGIPSEETPVNTQEIPVLVPIDPDPSSWLVPLPHEQNTYLNSICRPEGAVLRPLYKISNQLFTVYWDVVDENGWQALLRQRKAHEQEQARLEQLTMDRIQPADDPASQGHDFRSENPGFYRFDGFPCIESRTGWFSFDMRVKKGAAAGLLVDYWGGFRGPREFLVKVNGVVLAMEDLSGVPYNQRGQVLYDIPASLTSTGKVTVTFESSPNHYAGPVFGVRTLLTE